MRAPYSLNCRRHACYLKFSGSNLAMIWILLLSLSFINNTSSQSDNCIELVRTLGSEETLCEAYPGFTPTITLGTTITKASQLVGNLSGNIYIAGDFTVDRTFSFVNAIIQVATGKQIVVGPTIAIVDDGYLNPTGKRITFTIDNADIFCCTGLWDGIDMASKCDIIIKNGSHIEDAEKAVSAINTDAVTLHITSTIFNRNKNGIYLSNSASSLYDPVFKKFSGNNFTCTSPLNGTSSGASETGLYLKNISTTIGSLPGQLQSQTAFINQDHGIRLVGPTTTLRANWLTFDLCWVAAILLEDGSSMTLENSEILNIFNKGIYGKSLRNLTVKNSEFHLKFHGFDYEPDSDGIFLEAFPAGGIVNLNNADFFTDNSIPITHRVRGLRVKGAQIASNVSMNVKNGLFEMGGVHVTCIEFDGAFPTAFKGSIENNNFIISNSQTSSAYLTIGIKGINGDKNNIKIIGNDFTGNGQSCTAIDIRNSMGKGVEISSNQFVGNWLTLGQCVAARNSTNLKICGNIDYFNAYSAFSFGGMCFGTELKGNTIYGGGSSINLAQSQTIIGIQKHTGNLFYPTYIDFGPFKLYYTPKPRRVINTDPFVSTLYVHEPQSVWITNQGYQFFSPYHPYDIVPNDGLWFSWDDEGTPNSTCITQIPPDYPEPIDLLIANDDMDGVIASPALQWWSKWYLYGKLYEDKEYAGLDQDFEDFIQIEETTILGNLYKAACYVNKSLALDSVVQADVENINTKWDYFSLQKDSIADITTWNSQDRLNLNIISDSLYAFKGQSTGIDADFVALQSLFLDTALTILTSITSFPDDFIEYQWNLLMHRITILEYGLDGISQGDYDDILEISQLCIEEGGFAAMEMRSFITYCDFDELEEKLIQCDSVIIEKNPIPDTLYENVPFTTGIQIPVAQANKDLLISQNQHSIQPIIALNISRLQVFTIDGNIILELEGGFIESNQIDIGNLLQKYPPGMYFLSFYYTDNTFQIKKFVKV